MSFQKYKDQVKLMLTILPFVSKEKNFALHGGTAINLFQFNMPRLSVDVDLTYIPIQDRDTSLTSIKQSLDFIKLALEQAYPEISVEHKKRESKLIITNKKAIVKVEVNQIKRGCYTVPENKKLCIQAKKKLSYSAKRKWWKKVIYLEERSVLRSISNIPEIYSILAIC